MMSRHHLAWLAALSVLGGVYPARAAAQVCECQFRESNDNGKVAGALGGGLFGGLLMAVLHFKHQHEAALQPHAVPISESPVPAPPVFAVSPGALDPVPALAAASRDTPRGAAKVGAPHSPATPAAMPTVTMREARREGLVPPKTATFLPAFALIGAGVLLLGLFLFRERSGRGRWR